VIVGVVAVVVAVAAAVVVVDADPANTGTTV
jgi:hypothetical protein